MFQTNEQNLSIMGGVWVSKFELVSMFTSISLRKIALVWKFKQYKAEINRLC